MNMVSVTFNHTHEFIYGKIFEKKGNFRLKYFTSNENLKLETI